MAGEVRAPELDTPLGWLNTDRPLRFDGELKGQVVVLDFWTYCCINCIHILPDLGFLEHKYKDEPVTFIGVHSAKFSNEASRETIRQAILRYEIQHPVVIDDGMKIWRAYAARSWPTVVVVDPRGYVVGNVAGEGNCETLDQMIWQALAQGKANGALAGGPLSVRREASVQAASGLAFPGKVFADIEAGQLYVADSNHNRIVIAELPEENGTARVIKVVGSGQIGRDDSPAEQATFNHPQGLGIAHGKLYVADTENHLIREIDLDSFEVRTVVGTGEMSNDRAGGGMGTQQGLNSPWDLAVEGSTLYVAMAGTHQIWRIDLPVGFARALAGNGRENIVDGPTETAALAQPSGICVANGTIYVADSEVSAIRGIDMAAERVFTIVGQGLFYFGDEDGDHRKAKLQHPLGVSGWGSVLLIADTYNHKIKVVDPGARTVRTLYGNGKAAASGEDGTVAFFEPGGLCVAGDRLFVADTNNHRIVAINLTTHEWREVAFEGLATPGLQEASDGDLIHTEPIVLAPNQDARLLLDIRLPAQAHLSAEAPWSIRVRCHDRILVQTTGKSDRLPLSIGVPARPIGEDTSWRVTAALAYCMDGGAGLCVPAALHWHVPVRIGGDATEARIAGSIPSLS